jgi:hypothetical protein
MKPIFEISFMDIIKQWWCGLRARHHWHLTTDLPAKGHTVCAVETVEHRLWICCWCGKTVWSAGNLIHESNILK